MWLTNASPLSATLSPPSSTKASSIISPLAKSQDVDQLDQNQEAQRSLLDNEPESLVAGASSRSLSFVLDAAIYHPLSQVDIPVPFRRPPVAPPPSSATIAQALSQLDSLIANCDFLGAAHFSAMCLTSGLVQPTDHTSIFRLLATRYSCLELIRQLLLAAQEAKALEDLSSDFYYVIPTATDTEIEAHNGARPIAQHIMPFSLRIQAIRLQNIGFSDPRRGVTALYDLGLEAREHIASPYTSATDREIWKNNLRSLRIHVVNALVELGDLDCAQRTLAQSKLQDTEEESQWTSRMVLLLLKLGQLDQARAHAETLGPHDRNRTLLLSILATANGKVEDGATLLENVTEEDAPSDLAVLAKQNLAVAYLYAGRILDAKLILEGLVETGHSFQSLIVNLATIFDLTSDKSREQKMRLVNKLASSQTQRRPFTNADFKL